MYSKRVGSAILALGSKALDVNTFKAYVIPEFKKWDMDVDCYASLNPFGMGYGYDHGILTLITYPSGWISSCLDDHVARTFRSVVERFKRRYLPYDPEDKEDELKRIPAEGTRMYDLNDYHILLRLSPEHQTAWIQALPEKGEPLYTTLAKFDESKPKRKLFNLYLKKLLSGQ